MHQRAFTLIEILMYVAILTIVGVLVAETILPIITTFGKASTLRSLNDQGTRIIERLTREIRLAHGVDRNASTLEPSPGVLTLRTVVAHDDQTQIQRAFFKDSTSGALMLQEEGGTALPLSTDSIIEHLSFSDTVVIGKYATTEGLIGYWPLDEGNGTLAGDATGNGNNGTLMNMSEDDWENAKINTGLDFEGNDEQIFIPHNALLEPPNLTISLWAKFDGAHDMWIMAKKVFGQPLNYNRGYVLRTQNSDSTVYWAVGNDTGGRLLQAPYIPNQWYHIAGTYDGNEAKLYINGDLIDQGVLNGGIDYSNTGDVYVGNSSDGSFDLFGKLDEIRLYDRALSQEEIQALYRAEAITIEARLQKGSGRLFSEQTFRGTATLRSGYNEEE